MHLKPFNYMLALSSLAALLAACQTDTSSAEQKTTTSATEEYKSPSDVQFIHDDQGNVLKSLPVVVLNDIHAQLIAQGKTALAKNISARYDFLTGEVKDPRAADRAEQYLKSMLTQQPVAIPEAPQAEAKVLNPDELPAAIQIPDDMIQNLKKAAAQGGAK